MIKAELNSTIMLTDNIGMRAISVERKGTHSQIVHEFAAILDSLLKNEKYKTDIYHIMENAIDKEIKIYKENK